MLGPTSVGDHYMDVKISKSKVIDGLTKDILDFTYGVFRGRSTISEK